MGQRQIRTTDETFYFNFEAIVRETDKAKLFRIEKGHEVWIAKSLIIDEGDDTVGIPQWLADEKELV